MSAYDIELADEVMDIPITDQTVEWIEVMVASEYESRITIFRDGEVVTSFTIADESLIGIVEEELGFDVEKIVEDDRR